MNKPVFGTTLLVVGAEDMLAGRAVEARLAAARAQVPDVQVTRLSASDLAGNSQFVEAIGGSLFASHSAVVVTDLAGLPADLVPLLTATAADPGQTLCLTLVHGGGAKGKALLDSLAKAGVQRVAADPMKSWEVDKFVLAEARHAKVRLDDRAARALVDAVGTDLRALAAAVLQLGADWPDEPITESIVARYFAGRAEVSGFAVADDVMRARPGQALVKLRWALSTGVSPVLVTSALAGSLRSLGKYLDVRASRLSDLEVARQIGVPSWKVKRLAEEARGWTPSGVAAAIRLVASADAKVKGAASSAEYALEQMLLQVEAARTA